MSINPAHSGWSQGIVNGARGDPGGCVKQTVGDDGRRPDAPTEPPDMPEGTRGRKGRERVETRKSRASRGRTGCTGDDGVETRRLVKPEERHVEAEGARMGDVETMVSRVVQRPRMRSMTTKNHLARPTNHPSCRTKQRAPLKTYLSTQVAELKSNRTKVPRAETQAQTLTRRSGEHTETCRTRRRGLRRVETHRSRGREEARWRKVDRRPLTNQTISAPPRATTTNPHDDEPNPGASSSGGRGVHQRAATSDLLAPRRTRREHPDVTRTLGTGRRSHIIHQNASANNRTSRRRTTHQGRLASSQTIRTIKRTRRQRQEASRTLESDRRTYGTRQ